MLQEKAYELFRRIVGSVVILRTLYLSTIYKNCFRPRKMNSEDS